MGGEEQLQTLDLLGEPFLVGSPPGINVDAEVAVRNLHPDPRPSPLLDYHILDFGVVLHGIVEDGLDTEERDAVEFGLLTGSIEDGIPAFKVFFKLLLLSYSKSSFNIS